MSTTFSLLIFLVITAAATSSPATATSSPETAHAALSAYGFPTGLLPSAVAAYTINETSGDFAVRLNRKCQVTLPPDNYVATYSETVKGKITGGRINELDGIRVWAFFKWWGLTGIRVVGDGEVLVFEVGGITAKYPVKNFGESLECEGSNKASS